MQNIFTDNSEFIATLSANGDTHITMRPHSSTILLIKDTKPRRAACHVDFSEDSHCRIVHVAQSTTSDSFTQNITINFTEKDSSFEYFGLCDAAADADYNINVLVNHYAANCRSRQLFKAIAKDSAHINFCGKIVAAHSAAKTDARQTCKGILLSTASHICAMPQLEIYTDDLKCSHGAAIGHLDENALFYMQARGIRRSHAQEMLLHAFAQEILEKQPTNPIFVHK